MQPTILWDNDGVLVDTEALFFEANRRYFDLHGIKLDSRQYLDWFLCSSAGAWHLLRARGWSEEQVAEGRQVRNSMYGELLRASPDLAIPGMERLFERVGGHARMAVVTSSRRDHFERIHERTSFLEHIALVVAAGDYAQEKPAPEPYLVALDRLQVDRKTCIAVEDSPRGLQAAQAAGIDCVILRTQLTRTYPFVGATAIVESVEELHATLQDWLESQSALAMTGNPRRQ